MIVLKNALGVLIQIALQLEVVWGVNVTVQKINC